MYLSKKEMFAFQKKSLKWDQNECPVIAYTEDCVFYRQDYSVFEIQMVAYFQLNDEIRKTCKLQY